MAAQCAVAPGTDIRVGVYIFLHSCASPYTRGSMMDAFVVSGSPSHGSGMAIVEVLSARNPALERPSAEGAGCP